MTWNAQSNAKRDIEKTLLGAFSRLPFLPEYLEGFRSMVSVKNNGFAVAASCVALLACVVVSAEYGVSPSDVLLGFSHYLLLSRQSMLPVGSVLAGSFTSHFGLLLFAFFRFKVVARKKLRDSHFSVHPSGNRYRFSASTLTEVFSLILLNPFVNASIVGLGMIASVGKVFNVPCHSDFNGIKFNEGYQANRVNCWKPHRMTPRAISSQAASTLAEGSSTTGAIQFA